MFLEDLLSIICKPFRLCVFWLLISVSLMVVILFRLSTSSEIILVIHCFLGNYSFHLTIQHYWHKEIHRNTSWFLKISMASEVTIPLQFLFFSIISSTPLSVPSFLSPAFIHFLVYTYDKAQLWKRILSATILKL